MRFAALLALLLAASMLAGCSGKPPTTGRPAGPAEAGPAAAAAKPFSTLRYSSASKPVHEVVWANGTMSAQDTCNLGGCVLDDSKAFRTTDLTGLVPQGVPTLLTVALDWNPNPVGFGGWDLVLDAPDSTIYTRRDVSQAGHIEGQAVLRPSGAVSVVLAAYGPGGDVPATGYTLRIQVDSEPKALLPGVPVGVALKGGDTVRADGYGGGEAAFLLYGPDDARLGLYQGRHTLPSAAPAGHYVVLLPFGGPVGNVSADSGADTMDALGLRTEVGPWSTVPPNGALDASWDAGGVPVGVGFNGQAGDNGGLAAPMVTSGLMAQLDGPDGYVLDGGEVCGFCLSFGFSYSTDSGTGDPAIVPGTYTLHAQSDAAAGMQFQPFAIYVQR